jgi:hypothetical protein
MRAELRTEPPRLHANCVDLAGQGCDRIHWAVLRVVGETSVQKGCDWTHVADIFPPLQSHTRPSAATFPIGSNPQCIKADALRPQSWPWSAMLIAALSGAATSMRALPRRRVQPSGSWPPPQVPPARGSEAALNIGVSLLAPETPPVQPLLCAPQQGLAYPRRPLTRPHTCPRGCARRRSTYGDRPTIPASASSGEYR